MLTEEINSTMKKSLIVKQKQMIKDRVNQYMMVNNDFDKNQVAELKQQLN